MRWCVFLLCCTLSIQFRLVRFLMLLDYIKLALFLFLFITDFQGYVRGWRWTLHYYAGCHQGGYFLCRHLHCHFHHCVVIFSHPWWCWNRGRKFSTEVHGFFWTLYSSMIYQYAAEGQHKTAIVYFLIEMVSSAKLLAYVYTHWIISLMRRLSALLAISKERCLLNKYYFYTKTNTTNCMNWESW